MVLVCWKNLSTIKILDDICIAISGEFNEVVLPYCKAKSQLDRNFTAYNYSTRASGKTRLVLPMHFLSLYVI